LAKDHFWWTPKELAEAQLEQCFGWASDLFGTRYSARGNPRGYHPLVVEHRRCLVRQAGGAHDHERGDIICAMVDTNMMAMGKWINIPRWRGQAWAVQQFKKDIARKKAKAKEDIKYIVESTYRTKKQSELFFDQAAK